MASILLDNDELAKAVAEYVRSRPDLLGTISATDSSGLDVTLTAERNIFAAIIKKDDQNESTRKQ